MSFLDSGKCDVCLKSMNRPEGYLLTTTEIVRSPGYWRAYYNLHKEEFTELKEEFTIFDIHSYEEFCRVQPFIGTVFAIAAMGSPWLVCDKCIPIFSVDRAQALDYAQRWWRSRKWWRFRWTFRPPGSGPARISAVNMGDGKRWQDTEEFIRGLESEQSECSSEETSDISSEQSTIKRAISGESTFNFKDCPHCSTAGVLPMSGNRCPNCKKPL